MEHFDVLIVGAGLSGIGAGAHLRMNCPDKSFAILEGREAMGGTWDLFKYPGIRSDSDMYTLGYRFRPWTDPKAIADGPAILKYIQDTADDFDLTKEIRYDHRVHQANWSSEDARWTVRTKNGDVLTCNFLYLCTGYYDYEEGYTPDFEGVDDFRGKIIHPQKWPEDLDYKGKHVVIIGSGATAVTLLPAMTDKASHVTMLQRSPTYIMSLPSEDIVANTLRAVLPSKAAYALTRWKNVLMGILIFQLSRRTPGMMKRLISKGVEGHLGYDVAQEHFKPSYNPWDQRLCLAPDADIFKAIKKGDASVVTEHIDKFTREGLLLKSGKKLDADIIITATGLNMKIMAGLELVVDGAPVTLSDHVAYKGMMYNDIPNAASAFGYTNASWTLKCDLTADYVCRLLNHMDEEGFDYCTPRLNDPEVETVRPVDFTSGYFRRAMKTLPKQGSKTPWKVHQNYVSDMTMLRLRSVEDGAMEFSKKQAVPKKAVAAV